ncbi:MAG: fimbrillin family protein, partial [Rikenellaceae bacterium]
GSSSDSASDNLQPTLPPYSYEESDTPIDFDGYEQSATRAAIRENDFENGDAFGVYAYLKPAEDGSGSNSYPLQNYMENLKVTYSKADGADSGTWFNSQTKYWPADTNIKIRFFAYYPVTYGSGASVAAYTASDDGFPTITYTPLAMAAYQGDFMTAMTDELYKGHELLYSNGDPANGTYTGVPLSFKHHLTQVKFSANHNGTDNETVKVTKIVLKGAMGTNTGKFNAGNDDADNDGFKWGDVATNETSYTVSSGFTTGNIINVNDVAVDAATKYTTLHATNDAILLLLPQTPGDGDITLEVTFEMTLDNGTVIIAMQTFAFPGHTYTEGAGVNYQIPIAVDQVSSIILGSVTYEAWEEVKNDNDEDEDFYTGTLK